MQKKSSIFKSNKGITLIVLVIAILMLIIISSVIIYNSTSSVKMKVLNDMYNDIRLLNEQVFLYYSKNETLPIVEDSYVFGREESEIQDILLNYDTADFYVIDIDKMDKNIRTNLKNGKDYYDGTYNEYNKDDVYIINIKTHQIFYAKGIVVDQKVYYTLPTEELENGKNIYTPITVSNINANPPILENNMIPFKYSGASLVETKSYDKDWYDYSVIGDLSTWAMAKDENDVTYIWVPRLAYKEISPNIYDIVFLKGKTDVPIDQTQDISGIEWKISDKFKDEDNIYLNGIWLDVTSAMDNVQGLVNRLKPIE